MAKKKKRRKEKKTIRLRVLGLKPGGKRIHFRTQYTGRMTLGPHKYCINPAYLDHKPLMVPHFRQFASTICVASWSMIFKNFGHCHKALVVRTFESDHIRMIARHSNNFSTLCAGNTSRSANSCESPNQIVPQKKRTRKSAVSQYRRLELKGWAGLG